MTYISRSNYLIKENMIAMIHRCKTFLSFGLILFLMNCGSDSEEPTVDCSTTTLKIALDSVIPVTCSTLGTIIVSSTGGEGAIEYSIDGNNFQASATFTDLAVEAYSITAKDNLGCTAVLATNVTGNSSGNVAFTTAEVEAGCGTSNGSITVSATGGNGTLQYSLNDGTFGNSNVFSSLSSGSYNVTVQDSDLCKTSESVKLTNGIKLASNVQPIINQNCAVSGCHGGSQSPNLTTAAAIVTNAANIKARTGAKTMPPAGRTPLSQSDIDLISCWVDDGALNN